MGIQRLVKRPIYCLIFCFVYFVFMPEEKHNWLSLPSPGTWTWQRLLRVISPAGVCVAWSRAVNRGRWETPSTEGAQGWKVHIKHTVVPLMVVQGTITASGSDSPFSEGSSGVLHVETLTIRESAQFSLTQSCWKYSRSPDQKLTFKTSV